MDEDSLQRIIEALENIRVQKQQLEKIQEASDENDGDVCATVNFNASEEVRYVDMEQGASLIPVGELLFHCKWRRPALVLCISRCLPSHHGYSDMEFEDLAVFRKQLQCDVDPAIYFKIDEETAWSSPNRFTGRKL